jgi:hypothetical protein
MAEVTDHEELIAHLRGIRKIVINTDYGGFRLSHQAQQRYLELAGIEYTLAEQLDRDSQIKYGHMIMINGTVFSEDNISRDDPALISVVQELKEKANGKYSKLKIVSIPANVKWQIENYDGKEWVAEEHRTWS